MLSALPLVLAALGGATWTVDDDGPAQFASIQAAVDSPLVQDGDSLLVHAGSYGDVHLTKSLDLLAADGGGFSCNELRVQPVAAFSVAGMRAYRLIATGVTGRARVDGCTIGGLIVDSSVPAILWSGRTEFTSCAAVVITRSTLRGSESCYPNTISDYDPALTLDATTAAVVSCDLWGGNDDVCSGHPVSRRSPALHARNGSDVVVAASNLVGGDAPLIVGMPAVLCDDSTVRVRGASANVLQAGAGGAVPALAVDGTAPVLVTVSGVTPTPPTLPVWVVTPVPAEAFLTLDGPDGPLGVKTLALHAELGARAVIGVSRVPAIGSSPLGPIWISASSPMRILRRVGAGQDVAVPIALPLGALGYLPGATLDAQARVVGSGGQVLTNPVQALVRW
jgi:hypothetical protein